MATATQTIDVRVDAVGSKAVTEAVHVEDVAVGDITDRLEKTELQSTKPTKTFTEAEVARHNKVDDFWMIVRGEVYDMTKFQYDHPGGHKILSGSRGKDGTKKYMKYHRLGILSQHEELVLGKVAEGGEAPKEQKKLLGLFRLK